MGLENLENPKNLIIVSNTYLEIMNSESFKLMHLDYDGFKTSQAHGARTYFGNINFNLTVDTPPRTSLKLCLAPRQCSSNVFCLLEQKPIKRGQSQTVLKLFLEYINKIIKLRIYSQTA